jgi:hypothetical protein
VSRENDNEFEIAIRPVRDWRSREHGGGTNDGEEREADDEADSEPAKHVHGGGSKALLMSNICAGVANEMAGGGTTRFPACAFFGVSNALTSACLTLHDASFAPGWNR